MIKIKKVDLKKPKIVRRTRMRQCKRCDKVFSSTCRKNGKLVCDECNQRPEFKKSKGLNSSSDSQ